MLDFIAVPELVYPVGFCPGLKPSSFHSQRGPKGPLFHGAGYSNYGAARGVKTAS
jgi:hypothetical protein